MRLDQPPPNLSLFPHRCDLTRVRPDGVSPSGGRVETTVAIGRMVPCRIAEPSADDANGLAIQGATIAAIVHFPTDPALRPGDRIEERTDAGSPTGRGFLVGRVVPIRGARLKRWKVECKARIGPQTATGA